MTITTDVPHGAAEQLARVAHFAGIQPVQSEELEEVAHWILAQCAVPVTARAATWEHIRDDADRLWHLLSDDWSDDDLDELTEAEWERHSFATQQQEQDWRYDLTRSRLCVEIEQHVHLARYSATEAARAAVDGQGRYGETLSGRVMWP